MDPLSITAAVATLLGCCITAGVALRKFLIGASEVKMVVQAMMADLRALRSVLETMEITFEEMNSDKPAEGHIGAHWVDLFQSLGDSQQSIVSLQIVLEEVGKDVKFMDSTRKQIRIKTDSHMQTGGPDIQGCTSALFTLHHGVSISGYCSQH